MYNVYRQANLDVFPPIKKMENLEVRYKGNCKVYVEKEEDVERVYKLIEEQVGDFEYGYIPSDFVEVYNNDFFDTVCIGKFEINLATLLNKTQELGIKCFIVEEESDEYY